MKLTCDSLGSRDGTVAWIRFQPGAIRGLSLLLFLVFSEGFSPSSQFFVPSQKPTSLNFNLTSIEDANENQLRLMWFPL